MKECPRCSRVYADESLRFCLDDGASLVSRAAAGGAQETMRINPPRTRSAKATEVLPGSRITPPTQRQSVVPWIVAGAALLLVAVMGLGVTVIILTKSTAPNTNSNSAGLDRKTSSPTPTVIDLTGTRWTQTNAISQMKEFNFLANGTINGDAGDTWKQNGNSLTMSITNGYAIYKGTITGDRIDYKAHNTVNLDWTGTLYRAK